MASVEQQHQQAQPDAAACDADFFAPMWRSNFEARAEQHAPPWERARRKGVSEERHSEQRGGRRHRRHAVRRPGTCYTRVYHCRSHPSPFGQPARAACLCCPRAPAQQPTQGRDREGLAWVGCCSRTPLQTAPPTHRRLRRTTRYTSSTSLGAECERQAPAELQARRRGRRGRRALRRCMMPRAAWFGAASTRQRAKSGL